MSKAYEQRCIVPEHIYKMVFATVLGTFRSQVMQMGDCNAPSTFQRLMTAIFHDCISQFIHVYLDNIFIFSCSVEEHERHLRIIFQQLQDHHLFLSKSKVDLNSKRLECLSCCDKIIMISFLPLSHNKKETKNIEDDPNTMHTSCATHTM